MEKMTRQEQVVFDVFQLHAGEVLAPKELLDLAWEGKSLTKGTRTRTVDSYVSRLRKKIGTGHIETVIRKGYRWVPETVPTVFLRGDPDE